MNKFAAAVGITMILVAGFIINRQLGLNANLHLKGELTPEEMAANAANPQATGGGGGGMTQAEIDAAANMANANQNTNTTTTTTNTAAATITPSCGDKVCEGGETWASCPEDCPDAGKDGCDDYTMTPIRVGEDYPASFSFTGSDIEKTSKLNDLKTKSKKEVEAYAWFECRDEDNRQRDLKYPPDINFPLGRYCKSGPPDGCHVADPEFIVPVYTPDPILPTYCRTTFTTRTANKDEGSIMCHTQGSCSHQVPCVPA